MINVILALHLMVAVALVCMVLMQRSEGGALGMGGGGGSLMSGRGAANVLARGTGILGGVFFLTSISLTLMAGGASGPKSVVDAPASSPLAPITEMIDRLTKGNSKPEASIPAPAATIPAPAAPLPVTQSSTLAPPAGEIVPAPGSVVQRAAPLPETPPVIAAAPKPVSSVLPKPAPSAAPKPATPVVALAPKPSVNPAGAIASQLGIRPVQIQPQAPLTSVKPAESTEVQTPAEKPRGRAGPDE